MCVNEEQPKTYSGAQDLATLSHIRKMGTIVTPPHESYLVIEMMIINS